MLPGFRFLFAATALTMSMLIFGLGAAALLRAAHEQFVSIPSRRAAPEPQFAQSEAAGPRLAMLRVDSLPPMQNVVTDQPAVAAIAPVASPPVEQKPENAPAAIQPETVAASAPTAPEKEVTREKDATAATPQQLSEPQSAELPPPAPAGIEPPQVQAAASPAGNPPATGTPDGEVKVAAIAAAPAADETASVPSKPATDRGVAFDPEATMVAALGEPAVAINPQAAEPPKVEALKKKRRHARRSARHRRLARAAAAQGATVNNPFVSPFPFPADSAAKPRL